MSRFVADLWESVFTPGPTPSLLLATNATFACLQAVLAALLLATHSIHFVVLSALCAGLWWSINWFARELQASHDRELKEQAHAARQAAAAAAAAASSSASESETEVESVAGRQAAPKASSREVEVQAPTGTLKQRAAVGGSQGSKSSVSTEDEWEKVSEGENEKSA